MLKTLGPLAPRSNKPEELPKHFIDSVVSASDIERVVGGVVELKRSGHNLFGLCPFHGEKSPSFSVSPQKQIYHCFGCGANGDAISFLREHAALSFREAVVELAEMAGIPLPSSAPGAAPAPDLSAMVATNELAAKFFRHCLKHTEKAKEYVRGRRITPDAAKKFVIGYSPDGWQSLQEPFKDYKTNPHLVELGLVIDKDGRRYDRFRDRLLFGIRDARGRIVGFGGRSMDGSEPKYLNSPASTLFDKSSQLFGVFEAREKIRQTKQVIVTEGYIDTIANSMAGVEQTVATMGTACTEHHLERLCALAPEVIFSFDGDKAGVAAAWKSLQTCLPFATDDRTFRFLILPAGMDPDEFINAKGVDAYKAMLATAQSLSSFMLNKLATDNADLVSAENRAKFMADGQALLALMPPAGNLRRILKDELIKASALTREELAQMTLTRPTTYAQRQSQTSPWTTLTQAVLDQKATASQAAEDLIGVLSAQQQDDFFNSKFDGFPEHQQAFWRALDGVILQDDPQDSESPISMAQRDLIRGALPVVKKLMARDASAQTKLAFRAGQATEEEFLSQSSARGRQQDT